MAKIVVIGSGFAGLACSAYLAKEGHDVTVLEKNEMAGGRASVFQAEGFTFDMGPSWYWMPEVFENFFQHFGKKSSDYYRLERVSPSYTIYFPDNQKMIVPSNLDDLKDQFESLEPGSAGKLDQFLKEAQYKYDVGMNEFVWKPSHSIFEFVDARIISSAFRLQLFSSIAKHIRKYFSHPQIIQMLEFPVLFLGAKPENTPALYSLMNYADIVLGTWYPMGGMYEIVKAMTSVAQDQGVKFLYNHEVTDVSISKDKIYAVNTSLTKHEADYVVGAADYHHIDQDILPIEYRNYSTAFWDKQVMAPSSLLYYIGVNKKIDGLVHHNLFFDANFNQHASEIYDEAKWPMDPLFYVCAPSVTDDQVAPDGCENLFMLLPLAPGLTDSEEMREKYFDIMLERLEKHTRIDIKEHIVYKRSFAMKDFKKRYHAFKGNAYGLANTLRQTAFLKPKLKHKRLNNLYFAGQLTTPGPGVPPSIISGCVVAKEILNKLS